MLACLCALKVAGRYLYSRKRDTWDDAFKKLGKCLFVAVYQQALFSLSSQETMSFFSVYDLTSLIISVSFLQVRPSLSLGVMRMVCGQSLE